MTENEKNGGLDEAAEGWMTFWDHPVRFVREVLGAEPAPYQADILDALSEFPRVAVRSGHGVGKTAMAAWAVTWFLVTRPMSKVPTTAPTFEKQVRDIFWAEIHRWVRGSALAPGLVLSQTRMAVRGHEEEWFAVGMSAARPENLEGFHAPYLLYVIDEAKGVSDPIFDGVQGALTTEARLLLISTPGARLGYFHRVFTNLRETWKTFHVPCLGRWEDGKAVPSGEPIHPRVASEWIETRKAEWGETSPVYQARVLGEFPDEGDDTLIALSWIELAEQAGPVRAGVILSPGLSAGEAGSEGSRSDTHGGEIPRGEDTVLSDLAERAHARSTKDAASPTPPMRSRPGLVGLGMTSGSHPPARRRRALGVDVARYGADLTVFTVVDGHPVSGARADGVGPPAGSDRAARRTLPAEGVFARLRFIRRREKKSVVDVAAEAELLAREWEVDVVAVDDTGVGGGVTDLLVEAGLEVLPVHFGGATSDAQSFLNLKAEIFWGLRRAFEAGAVGLDSAEGRVPKQDVDALIGQLSAMRYEVRRGGIRIVDPDEAARRFPGAARQGPVRSPDHAHSFALAWWAACGVSAAESVLVSDTRDRARYARRRIFS